MTRITCTDSRDEKVYFNTNGTNGANFTNFFIFYSCHSFIREIRDETNFGWYGLSSVFALAQCDDDQLRPFGQDRPRRLAHLPCSAQQPQLVFVDSDHVNMRDDRFDLSQGPVGRGPHVGPVVYIERDQRPGLGGDTHGLVGGARGWR